MRSRSTDVCLWISVNIVVGVADVCVATERANEQERDHMQVLITIIIVIINYYHSEYGVLNIGAHTFTYKCSALAYPFVYSILIIQHEICDK